MNPAIRVENLSKRYRLGTQQSGDYRTLREAIVEKTSGAVRYVRARSKRPAAGSGGAPAESAETFWALKDVDFEVQPGEVVGIIGRNGAGKSTLLKVLSQITEPTSGRVELRGRMGSLLEVGTGFHPELTGRENVYLNGSILGMSRREIERNFDEIVAFAEIEQFLDTPVKRYSSGMYVRLAFAVAAHLEPDILVVDEVLAVGDQAFQRKCLGKMREVGRSGRTVLFVSHNTAALEALCDRCVILEHGRLTALGTTREILAKYYGSIEDRGACSRELNDHRGRQRGLAAMMTRVSLQNGEGQPKASIRMAESLAIRVDFDTQGRAMHPVLGVVVKSDLGIPLLGVNNRFIPGYEFAATNAAASITCRLDRLTLMPGRYLLDLYLGDDRQDLDVIHEALSFEVVQADVFGSGKIPPQSAGPIFSPAHFDLQQGTKE